jgi:hypothetical protein
MQALPIIRIARTDRRSLSTWMVSILTIRRVWIIEGSLVKVSL